MAHNPYTRRFRRSSDTEVADIIRLRRRPWHRAGEDSAAELEFRRLLLHYERQQDSVARYQTNLAVHHERVSAAATTAVRRAQVVADAEEREAGDARVRAARHEPALLDKLHLHRRRRSAADVEGHSLIAQASLRQVMDESRWAALQALSREEERRQIMAQHKQWRSRPRPASSNSTIGAGEQGRPKGSMPPPPRRGSSGNPSASGAPRGGRRLVTSSAGTAPPSQPSRPRQQQSQGKSSTPRGGGLQVVHVSD